ncbi:hypothetical protein [Pedobacter caeni]|uniref:Uncharacterized protein n=1 Tax=Pedobacter caeni TaxID=288992 RepID=A0A1M5KUP5_9SPHI|nr:hypothetical protein [Pedobacter caeni]SHG56562.1 hypothetical protein SAMN04488522_106101 [Pedobacter caeni]
MNYQDYQKASAKHLLSCQSILLVLDSLNSENNDTKNHNQKIKVLLHNLFYLSGYTLESIINYSIYKHFRWSKSSIYEIDHNFSSKCDLTFYPDVPRQNGRGNYLFYISQHEFSRNIQILSKALPNSKVPLIDRTISVDKDLINLFLNWKVEIRYHPESTQYSTIELTIDNIKRFVSTTDQVYNGLMKLVG